MLQWVNISVIVSWALIHLLFVNGGKNGFIWIPIEETYFWMSLFPVMWFQPECTVSWWPYECAVVTYLEIKGSVSLSKFSESSGCATTADREELTWFTQEDDYAFLFCTIMEKMLVGQGVWFSLRMLKVLGSKPQGVLIDRLMYYQVSGPIKTGSGGKCYQSCHSASHWLYYWFIFEFLILT